MLNEPTREKLTALRLGVMAEAWAQQQRDPRITELTFDERLGLLIDAEHDARHNRRLARLLKDAELRIATACLEDVDAAAARGIDKPMIRQLATCTWIGDHLNVLVTGPTGVGKSYLASALAHQACRQEFSVRCLRLPRLIEELARAEAQRKKSALFRQLAKVQLLMLDDFGLTPLTDSQQRDLLELLDDRYDKASTLVTSQLPIDRWHAYLGDPTLADAILDRLIHNAHRIPLSGDSMRARRAANPAPNPTKKGTSTVRTD